MIRWTNFLNTIWVISSLRRAFSVRLAKKRSISSRTSLAPVGLPRRPTPPARRQVRGCSGEVPRGRSGKPSAPRAASPALEESALALLLVDLKRSPADIIALLPSPKEDSAAFPSGTLSGPNQDYSEDLRWLLARLDTGESVRINCGGKDYRARDERLWGRDRFFTWGRPRLLRNATFSDEVEGTKDDLLYATERFFQRVPGVPSSYWVPLPRGKYEVTLHLTKSGRGGPATRSLDVFIEGTKTLESYDLSSAGSYTPANQKSFRTRVDDGLLEIEFVSEKWSSRIAAIEIARLK